MSRIEVIGTSHVAEESIEAVRRKIFLEKPNIVTVELDPIRFRDLMSKKKIKRRVRLRDIRRLGFFGWLFAFIGTIVQRKLGKKAGAEPGSDMKAAVLAARGVKSHIVLIDRSIGETVSRLSKTVPLSEKLKLFWFLLFGWIFERKELEKLNKMDLRKVPRAAVVHELISDFKHKFPNMYRVLVTERDTYMAKRIKFLARKFPEAHILVVVGAGHVEGLRKTLDHKKQ